MFLTFISKISSGAWLGGHVRAVFTLTTIIFVICVSYTITSFKEMPLALLELRAAAELDEDDSIKVKNQNYGSLEVDEVPVIRFLIFVLQIYNKNCRMRLISTFLLTKEIQNQGRA